MRGEQSIRFSCGGLVLEGALWLPAEGPAPGVALCHPHPLYGGSMDNAVVLGLAQALVARGIATLRFNFRGTGRSEGRHGAGEAEVEDVGAALDVLSFRPEVDPRRLAVAGYSFGGAVGLRAACADSRVRALVLVAPPLAAFPMTEAPRCPIPKLVVAGTRDEHCPVPLLEAWFAGAAEPKRRVAVSGADHFFFRREAQVGEAAGTFLEERLAAPQVVL
ncbi:MAG: alpha/beta hydrolase [Deferrisomatales bacterium]